MIFDFKFPAAIRLLSSAPSFGRVLLRGSELDTVGLVLVVVVTTVVVCVVGEKAMVYVRLVVARGVTRGKVGSLLRGGFCGTELLLDVLLATLVLPSILD